MVATLRKELMHSLTTFKKSKKEKWVKDTPGQMIITGSQVLPMYILLYFSISYIGYRLCGLKM